jgi:hypothetical protein
MSDITNVASCIKRLRAAGENAKNRVTAGMKSAADYVKEEAQRLVPKETGALHDSIHLVISGTIRKGNIDVVAGGDNAPYGLYVHEDPTKAHGAAFNIKYQAEISKGQVMAKQPDETFHFLSIPASELTTVRRAMWRGINGRRSIIV